MSYPRLHALGACLISLLYPLLAILMRDAVFQIMLIGTLLLGAYRYLLGIGIILRGGMPDLLAFLFVPCKGRWGLRALVLAIPAALMFAALMLLPARILLDVSVDLAKPAFFAPAVYCAVTAWLLFRVTE